MTDEIKLGSHFFRQRYLYAFATRAEVVTHVRTQTLEEEMLRSGEILSKWEALQPRIRELISREAGVADQPNGRPLPASVAPLVRDISEDALFRKTFSHTPIEFAIVEIDRLVAPQRAVNLDYVDHLQTLYRGRSTIQELAEICLPPRRAEMPPIQHLEVAQNVHAFTSPNLDIRFLGAFLKKLSPEDLQFAELGGIPAAALIGFVGYGGSSVNVLGWQDRLVLNNGFHRVYALRALNVLEIPVVIQRVHNTALEFPATVAGLPREYLVSAPRPVLMKDYLEDDFCIALKAKDRVRVVTVQTGLSQFDAPS